MIRAEPLTADDFASFGDVLDAQGDHRLINGGLCARFHDRARMDFGTGRAGLSVFRAEPRALPYRLTMVERHPDGSQAFVPMTEHPFLVIVAQGREATPGRIRAFVTAPGQGINLLRGTWHGVLTPLHAPGLFAVVDRIGEGANLEEFHLAEPVMVYSG